MQTRLRSSLLSLTCSLALLLAPLSGAVAYADPVKPKPLVHQGVDGVWFERGDAERVLDEVKRVKDLEGTLETQDALVGTLKRQVKTATQALDLTAGALERSNQYGDHWHSAYLEEVERNNSIFNEPMFWTVVGIVIGGATAAGAAYAATR